MRHLVALRVLAGQCLVAERVLHDGAVAAIGGRSHPTHLEAGGGQADQVHLLRGRRGGCVGGGEAQPRRVGVGVGGEGGGGGTQIKQTKKKLKLKQNINTS